MKWKSSQLFWLCASKQETTSTTHQFGKLTKSHRKLRTNWNVENLKPSVVVASCGVWGRGAGSGNGRNERFCTLHHLYNTINFSCLHNAGKSLQTTPAPGSTCTSFCTVVYCWLGLPWLGANFHRFVSPGVAALVLSATCRGSWVTSSLKYAFQAFSAQPLKPRWTTRKIDYYRRAKRLKRLALIQ